MYDPLALDLQRITQARLRSTAERTSARRARPATLGTRGTAAGEHASPDRGAPVRFAAFRLAFATVGHRRRSTSGVCTDC